MNDNDMNEMFNKAKEMLANNQVPDEFKSIVSNFQKSNSNNNYNPNPKQTNNNQKNYNTYSQMNNRQTSSSNSNNSMPDIDMATLMKMQSIMSKMKSSDNDDMSRLLLSLKPYLRDEKKDKIDEYIKLIKMGRLTQVIESLGGDKHWI